MFLATTTAANSGVMSTGMLIMWLVIMFGMMYFLMIRPQKKEQKKLQAMLNDLAVGDAASPPGARHLLRSVLVVQHLARQVPLRS